MDFKNKVEIARLADCSKMEGKRGTGAWGIPKFLTGTVGCGAIYWYRNANLGEKMLN